MNPIQKDKPNLFLEYSQDRAIPHKKRISLGENSSFLAYFQAKGLFRDFNKEEERFQNQILQNQILKSFILEEKDPLFYQLSMNYLFLLKEAIQDRGIEVGFDDMMLGSFLDRHLYPQKNFDFSFYGKEQELKENFCELFWTLLLSHFGFTQSEAKFWHQSLLKTSEFFSDPDLTHPSAKLGTLSLDEILAFSEGELRNSYNIIPHFSVQERYFTCQVGREKYEIFISPDKLYTNTQAAKILHEIQHVRDSLLSPQISFKETEENAVFAEFSFLKEKGVEQDMISFWIDNYTSPCYDLRSELVLLTKENPLNRNFQGIMFDNILYLNACYNMMRKG